MYHSLLASMVAISLVTAIAIDTVTRSSMGASTAIFKRKDTPAATEWCADGVHTLCCEGDLPDNPTTEPIPNCKSMTVVEDCPVEPTDTWDSPGNKIYCCDEITMAEGASKGVGDGCYPVFHPGWDPIPSPANDPLGAPSYMKGLPAIGVGPALNGLKSVGEGAYRFGQQAAPGIVDFFNNVGKALNTGEGHSGGI